MGNMQQLRIQPPAYLGRGRMAMTSKYMSPDLYTLLQQHNYLIQAQVDPTSELSRRVPPYIHHYHTLFPLEDISNDDHPSRALGLRTVVLKGIHQEDGRPHALWRLNGLQIAPSQQLMQTATAVVQKWAPLGPHPNVVALRDVFVSKELDNVPSLYFAYDYHPGAVTLQQVHIRPPGPNRMVQINVTEPQLWSYAIQIASALRAVHRAGLVCRAANLAPSKVILTAKNRVRVNAVGIIGVLVAGEHRDMVKLHAQDLMALGRLLLCLACGTTSAPSLDFCVSKYSQDFVSVVRALLRAKGDGGIRDAGHLCGVLGQRAFTEMEQLHVFNDGLMGELGREVENGRLLRLLIKLGYINERPGTDMTPDWSETGDRYLLKLLRDYIFHNTNEDGTPMMDWGHVIECLNKLDAGVPEKILLMGRDETSMLVASYMDLRKCVETAYTELNKQAGAGWAGR